MRLLALMTFTTLSLAAAAASPAFAQSRAARGDSNGDGRLSLAEFTALQGDRLMRLDGDGDGKISLSEWSARPRGANAQAADPSRAFKRLDTNGDGAVDRHEIDAMSAQRFARLDADRDGQLTTAERQAQGQGKGQAKAKRAARVQPGPAGGV